MKLIRQKENTIKMILIKVGKLIGYKKVSMLGSMISPDFFFFFILNKRDSWQ